jgi:hypothetical protein
MPGRSRLENPGKREQIRLAIDSTVSDESAYYREYDTFLRGIQESAP